MQAHWFCHHETTMQGMSESFTQPLGIEAVWTALYNLHTDNHLPWLTHHTTSPPPWSRCVLGSIPFSQFLPPFSDLEYEEERGCSGEEEAKDKCCSDSCAKRLRFMVFTWNWLLNTSLPSTDLTELDLPSTMKTHFVDPADLLNFTLTITPDEGIFLLLWGTILMVNLIPC